MVSLTLKYMRFLCNCVNFINILKHTILIYSHFPTKFDFNIKNITDSNGFFIRFFEFDEVNCPLFEAIKLPKQ